MKQIALILGGASCLADDRRTAAALFSPTVTIATNKAGLHEPGPLAHWATMHPDLFPLWLTERRALGYPDPQNLWCPIGRPVRPAMTLRRVKSWGGSSGLLAVLVAFELGYDRVVVAGMPIDQTPHFDDAAAKPWRDGPNYRPSWVRRRAEMADRVRSMSGWTRELLGAPDAEWLGCR